MKREPFPGVLSTRTRPPCASAWAFTSASPIPTPGKLRVGDEFDLVERLEQPLELRGLDADAVVLDLELE